jgi:CHAT domain-containing protein/Tfp pilus assembly protein PilF
LNYQKKIAFLFLLIFGLFSLYINLFTSEKINSYQKYYQFFTQADQFRKEGNFNESLNLFEISLNIAKEIFDEKKECECLLKLGILYWNIGDIKEYKFNLKKAQEIAQKLNLEREIEQIHNSLEICRLYEEGKTFRSSGDYQKSIESFKEAINLAKNIGCKEQEVKCLRQICLNYWQLNKINEFYSFNDEGLRIAKELNHKIEQGRFLNNIGIFYWILGDYSKAIRFYKDAIYIAEQEKSEEDEVICLNNVGTIYLEIGSYDKAREYLLRALSINQKLGNSLYISKNLNNLGVTYRRIAITSRNDADLNKALDYYKECLKITKEKEDAKTEILALNNIGSVYSGQQRYEDAFKYFNEGLKKAEEAQDFEKMGTILTNIGIVNYNLENYDESLKYYEKAINLALGKDQILWETYMESARAYEKQNQLMKALENYKASIISIENIRSSIDLEDLRAKYLGTDKRIDAYHYLINLLVTYPQSHPEKEYRLEAYNYLEKAKARSFLDSLVLSRIDINQGIDPKLLSREKELMNDHSKFVSKLLAAELVPEEKNLLLEQIKEKENEMEGLELEIRTKNPAYAALNPEIITVKDTQEKLLNNNTAFFEYCIGKDQSYAFVITKKDLKIFPIPARDKIKKTVSDYLKAISDKDNKNFQAGYELFNTLVSPGLEKNIKTIIFIPDDILNFLPFETLLTNKEKNDWLIKNFKIAYAPSVSSLREIIHRKKLNEKKTHMDILALGDPYFGSLETGGNGNDAIKEFFSNPSINIFRLKYSGRELDEISTLFAKSKQKIFKGEYASKEQLKNNNLEEFKIIHFATHSIIDDKNPSRSSIVLSFKDQNEDGFLQVREIYNLKLNSDIVTLSACETGLGELIQGEGIGIECLNRAFFCAGTSAVLMSLWAVNDQASCQLMERFYRHLKSSESIMNALRNVKLEMIDSGVLSHPYYWAGFIVSGKGDEIIFPKSTSRWFLIGVSLVLAGGIIFAAVRSFKQRL